MRDGVLRASCASIWLTTGLSVLHPSYRAIGHEYLARLGLPDWIMIATCVFEIALGLRVLLLPPAKWLTWLQIAMVTSFTIILAIEEPMLLASPFGVLTKNIPFVGLLLYAQDRSRTSVLRVTMASIWITEGLFPKILFQQPTELAIAHENISFLSPQVFLALLGACQLASGLAVLVLKGHARRWILLGQLFGLVALPIIVSRGHLDLWVHPFGPLTKTFPIIGGTYLVIGLARDPFMTSRWTHLSMFHFTIAPDFAKRFLPEGVELDLHDGKAWVSFVCLEFWQTRVLGLPALFARRFSDVNLRLYVKSGGRRGVVFLREIASSKPVVWVANYVYREHFIPMQIDFKVDGDTVLRVLDGSHRVKMTASPPSRAADEVAQFFVERYFGFGKSRSGKTIVYELEHPPWAVREVSSYALDVDFEKLYGKEIAHAIEGPHFVTYAEGSEVAVFPASLHAARGPDLG